MFFTQKKKRTVENESWFYHIFHKNSVLVHAKTTTSYDTVENALRGYFEILLKFQRSKEVLFLL
jgi:hypothetical protein